MAADEQFHEGGAYQYQWLVPQDPAGLVRLMGGRAATEKRLDDFFAYPKLLADPAGTARTDWIASPYDYYAKPTDNPNNEPDLLAPYMYLWAGDPAKTATVVRAATRRVPAGECRAARRRDVRHREVHRRHRRAGATDHHPAGRGGRPGRVAGVGVAAEDPGLGPAAGRHDGQGVDGPPVSLFGLSLPIPAGKQIRSITLPDDPRLHLYAVTLT